MADIERARINGVEFDITGGIKEEITELKEELLDIDTLVGSGVIE